MRKKTLYKDKLAVLTDNINIFKDVDVLKNTKGRWKSLFGNDDPLALEIGMGNGAFLHQLIAFNEENEMSFNYIGLEVKEDRVYKSLAKNSELLEAGLLKLIIGYGQNIGDFFDTGELQHIYLNFSDPWPKERHEKKRLTAPSFLKVYEKLLAKDGDLFIKTDDTGLYKYTLETLKSEGWKIIENSEDLYAEDFTIKNFVTEFENRWIEKGKNIYYLHAKK